MTLATTLRRAASVLTLLTIPGTASMERYGGSSTPTFIFLDRKGIVRRSAPTRLTEAELKRSIRALLDQGTP